MCGKNYNSDQSSTGIKESPTVQGSVQQPTKDELEQLYSSLNECKVKPVCLSLVETYADEFISKREGYHLSEIYLMRNT